MHRFVEDPRLPGREAGFGVLGQSLNPKPAYCDLARLRGVSNGLERLLSNGAHGWRFASGRR